MVVSFSNKCSYCVTHHGKAALNQGDNVEIVEALQVGEIPVALAPDKRELLAWAKKGSEQPSASTEEDVHRLRALGFDDRAILDATLTVACFSFVNRLVLMLGVELEGDYEKTCGG